MKISSTTARIYGPLLLVIPIVVAVTFALVAGNSNILAQSETSRKEVAKPKASFPVVFNEQGELQRPTGYRKWTYVGTPLTPHDMNDGKAAFPEFHTVYMNPEAFNHYEKTGEFPDGTVLVKELISVGAKEASSGKGYFMGDFLGLEVSIKDKTHFKDEPGNWAYFSFGHKYPLKDRAVVQPAVSCNDCHNGEADEDYVFTQNYPVPSRCESFLEGKVARSRLIKRTTQHVKILVDANSKRILGAATLGIGGDEIVHSILDVMYANAPYTVLTQYTFIQLLPN